MATSLGFGVVQLDVSVVNVAIQPIRAQLGGGVTGAQWIVDAYTIAFAVFIISAGALGDRLGAKRVFAAGFALFTVASVGCGLAPGLPALIAGRVAQGVGAAVLVPCSLTLLNHMYTEPGARGRAVGRWAAGASVALSAGPLIGGVLTATLGWRSIFFITLPLGTLGLLLTLRFATETTRATDRPVDLPGQCVIVAALTALAGATVEGGRVGFGDPLVLVGFAVAAVMAVAFVIVESRRRHPMLPLRLFRVPTFASATGIGLVVNIAFYGLIFVFSLYFQNTRHYSVLATGLAFAPVTIAVLAANLLTSRFVAAFGARRVIAVAAVVLGAAMAGLLGIGARSGYAELVGQLTVVGFALGVIVPAMTTALLGSVDRSRSGVASGTLNTARQTGSVIGVALFGSLVTTELVGGLRIALAVSIGLALAVVALATGIDRRPTGRVNDSELSRITSAQSG